MRNWFIITISGALMACVTMPAIGMLEGFITAILFMIWLEDSVGAL